MLEDYTELLYVNVSYEVLALTLILRQMCANAHFGAQISWPAPYGPELLNLSLTVSHCIYLFHELLHRILSWSRLLYQHVSLSSSGTPQCPVIHHHVIPSLILEPKLLSPLHLYLSIPKAPLSQGFSSCMALHTITLLLLR